MNVIIPSKIASNMMYASPVTVPINTQLLVPEGRKVLFAHVSVAGRGVLSVYQGGAWVTIFSYAGAAVTGTDYAPIPMRSDGTNLAFVNGAVGSVDVSYWYEVIQ